MNRLIGNEWVIIEEIERDLSDYFYTGFGSKELIIYVSPLSREVFRKEIEDIFEIEAKYMTKEEWEKVNKNYVVIRKRGRLL